MRRILSTLLLLLVITGCGPRYVDYFPYHDDGTPKPRIALISVVDSSGYKLPWNLSREFTQEIKDELVGNGDVYLLSQREMDVDLTKLGTIDFFNKEISWAKCFCDADYAVALEFIEHNVIPYDQMTEDSLCTDKCARHSAVLSMKMRVKIINTRMPSCPQVVLHEILTCNQVIPWQRNLVDYETNCWGSENFFATPLGMAHQRLITDISCRIRETVELR